MTKTEIAYLAGILDGEGSISLVRSFAHRAGGRYLYPYVRITNCDGELLDWIRERFPSGHRGYIDFHKKRRDVHHLAWACSDAIRFLKLVLPYLVIKRRRAELAIHIWELREDARKQAGGYFGNGHPIPAWLVHEHNCAFAMMATFNRRGPR